ncbi:hypothetical protein QVD17_31191 [Tagetes erecta]|uniref:Uncharacterized protein n=1 Tax=Tagetes erecta TaxID=13708 RepID=A0AAD8NGS3_TARER|nr:hypothetical protein QVD17_31191 [Tagetes erecta]
MLNQSRFYSFKPTHFFSSFKHKQVTPRAITRASAKRRASPPSSSKKRRTFPSLHIPSSATNYCSNYHSLSLSLSRSLSFFLLWLMKMEGGIDPDAPLDYVELRIFPSRNRYEAYVGSSNREEKAASGDLKRLLLHSPRVKDLSSKGSNMNFKILPPDNVTDAEWFTISTLKRFLRILGSPDILSIGNEISQLEETRKFQLSLSLKAMVDVTSSIDSKNELLRAVDLRLTALKDEVVVAFDQAANGKCSTKDISDLENFAHHIGAKDIRDLLQKFVEMSIFPTVEDSKKSLRYDVSPKVSQIERHNSADDENSSFSSEEDRSSVERRRAATRSATPRRSASPMRRIQIGRSGSHRATALTIKSLNHFPTREKLSLRRDPAGNSSDEDHIDPDKPVKKNILRMSVQDKISLFESKQRDQKADVLKSKKLLNRTVGPNKAVLRRWSSGMGENATQNPKNTPLNPNNITPDPEPVPEPEPESDSFIHESMVSNVTAGNIHIKPHSPEREERYEKHPDSIEWTQQNEAKLNELFMKMMEDKNKSVQHPNPKGDISKSKKSPVLKEERGGSYDQDTPKADEKLQVETSGKKAEKKTEMASTNVNKPLKEKTQKSSTSLINSRKEPLKPSVLKKTATKPSSLSATRKSWSSAPSPRTPTGPASATITPTSRKPVDSNIKSEKSQPRSKTLKSPPPDASRNLKHTNQKMQSAVTKSTKTTKTKVQTPDPEVKPSFYNKVTKKSSVVPLEPKPFLRKGSGIGPGAGPVVIKSKVVDHPEETSRTLIHTEDNEVVMAIDISENEEKCEPQVVSLSPCLSPSTSLGRTMCEESMSSNVEETSRTLIHTEDIEVAMAIGLSENDEKCEPQVVSLSPCMSPSPNLGRTKCEESVSSNVELSEVINEEKEELMISPSAWVEAVADESDINHEEEMLPCLVQTESPVQVVVPSGTSLSPRVRRSLSQMLLEESNEEVADVTEWGNAEHPPSFVYQKDPPKGLKRLLKFARKTKAESALLEANDDAGASTVTSQNQLKVPEGHVSTSLNTTKGTRSFFSLSSFRVSKSNESKLL